MRDPGRPRIVRRCLDLVRADRTTWWIAVAFWISFYCAPIATGAAVKAVFDRIDHDRGGISAAALIGILALLETLRWGSFPIGVRQWHGAFEGWMARIRANLLRSLALDPRPPLGRLPETTGAAVSRFRDDTEDLAWTIDVWLDATGSLVSAAIAMVLLVAVDVRIALALVLPMALMILANRTLGRRLLAWRQRARNATAEVTGYLGEVFGSTLALKTAGAEEAALARFHELNVRRQRAAVLDQVALPMMESVAGATGEAAIGLVLLLAARKMRSGGFTLGDLSLFASYVVVLANFTRWMGRLLARQRQGEAALGRLAHVVGDERDVVADVDLPLRSAPPPLAAPSRCPADTLTVLEARGLAYRHPRSGRGIEDVDLTVRRGELVVVTGPVGSGKTTLVRALLGLLPDVEGEVRWNGARVDPAVFLVPPRAAYAPQLPALFSEALADNIALGLPVDDAELLEAARLACLGDDVARMATGTSTLVGPRGVRLSGGQVQRTALARLLVRRPELAVVDDVSSALDVATERALWARLLDGDDPPVATALIVSHRPLLLERADRVVALDHGRIAGVNGGGAP